MPNSERLMDGDDGFIGVDTRMNPSVMKEGYISEGINIRMEQMQLLGRKGLSSLISDGEFDAIGSVKGSCLYVDNKGNEKVALIIPDGMYLFNPTTQELSQKYNFPTEFLNNVLTTKTVDGRVNAIQAVNNIYILRGDLDRVLDGSAVSNSSPHTTITVTFERPHGLSVGDEFSIDTNHIQQNGSFFVQSVPSVFSFTYKLSIGHSGSGTATVYVGKAPLVWNGETNMKVVSQKKIDGIGSDFPICSVAIYHKNRIICKVNRDEIAVSDFLPDDNGDWKFDRTIQQYTINEGDGQQIVGFHPWTQDKVLVFKERSIYELKVADSSESPIADIANTFVKTLNSEIGCVARRSIANVGTDVYFLSQNGIYKLEPQLDTELLTNTVPISRQMQKYIDKINTDYQEFACGKVYNGRYYLSIPMIYENDEGEEVFSEYNNRVLVYSIVNSSWESIDIYPEEFDVENMIVMKYNRSSRLIMCDFDGSIFVAEDGDEDEYGIANNGIGPDLSRFNNFIDGNQQPVVIQGIPLDFSLVEQGGIFQKNPINVIVKSRAYSYDKTDQKRYSRVAIVGGTETNCGILISYKTRNPDHSQPINFISHTNNDFQSQTPIRKIGQDLMVVIECLTGQFYLNTIKVDAVNVGRSIKNNN